MYFRKRKKADKAFVDAEAAVQEATKNLHEVKSRKEEVHEVSEALRTIRERNHFAEQLEEILGGNKRMGGFAK